MLVIQLRYSLYNRDSLGYFMNKINKFHHVNTNNNHLDTVLNIHLILEDIPSSKGHLYIKGNVTNY